MVLIDNGSKGLNELRKLEHLRIVAEENVEGPGTTFLEYVFLPHQALVDASPEDVDISVKFLGKSLDAPLVISGMTGGAPGTEKINAALAEVASIYRIALGVGSERAAIENPSVTYTYRVVREVAPDVPLISNIGAAEVVRYNTRKVLRAVEVIDADALAIHLNIAQEAVQPEGLPSFKGFFKKLDALLKESPVPILVKEVGFGLSKEVASALRELGIKYFDVEGAGGTNWVLVEKFRATSHRDKIKELMALNLMEWGIPTAASILEVRTGAPDAVIIGSGGIRTAVDAVKALWLGADLVGMARPFLIAYMKGELREFTEAFLKALKTATLLTGSTNLTELKRKEGILGSLLREWVERRGLKAP